MQVLTRNKISKRFTLGLIAHETYKIWGENSQIPKRPSSVDIEANMKALKGPYPHQAPHFDIHVCLQ